MLNYVIISYSGGEEIPMPPPQFCMNPRLKCPELCMTVGKLPIVKLMQNNVSALYKEIQPHKVSYQFTAPVMIQKAKLNLHINSEVS